MNYPEIQLLQDFFTKHRVDLIVSQTTSIDASMIPVDFTFKGHTKAIQVVDEYEDIACNIPLLSLFLVLRELSILDLSTDFLDWCAENGLNASSEELRGYYHEILPFVSRFKSHFTNGVINHFISDLDYELNAGAAQFLRKGC